MRVHPAPRKRNITFRYNAKPRLSAAGAGASSGGRQKKLRRLSHMFSKVLELPLDSDADVSVEEGPDAFRFVAATDHFWDDVRAHAIEIYPGVMKVVIGDDAGEVEEEELDLDRWRFRLPPSSRPALATAAYADGELVVTIPKAEEGIGEAKDEGIIYASISTSLQSG